MKSISTLKIGILSVFSIAIICCGYIMYQRLSYNKQVFDTNIYELIPYSVSSVIQINKEKDINTILPYIGELNTVVKSLGNDLSYPVLLPEQDQNLYLMAKLTKEQNSTVKEILENTLFPTFAPKEKDYKGTKLYFYPTDNNSFFVCMFYKGVFVGGYNYKLLENIIDTNCSPCFFTDYENNLLYSKAKSTYSANIFVKKANIFTAINLNAEGKNLQIEGYTTSSLKDKWSCPLVPTIDSMFINYDIFPDSISSYQIDKFNDILSDSIICMFNAPIYQFYMQQKPTNPVFAIKHNCDRFEVYKLLNKIEQSYGHAKFSTRDVVLDKQHLYTTSVDMGHNIFKHNSHIHFCFYKGYLIFSADKSTLIEYLKNNGNYKLSNNENIEPNETNQLISVFYSQNLNERSPSYIHIFDNQIIKKSTSKAYIKIYIEDELRKIVASLNN